MGVEGKRRVEGGVDESLAGNMSPSQDRRSRGGHKRKEADG